VTKKLLLALTIEESDYFCKRKSRGWPRLVKKRLTSFSDYLLSHESVLCQPWIVTLL